MNTPVAVLGGGAWGTAFATLLAENGHTVRLWCHEQEVASEINSAHENARYLPGTKLDDKIVATTSLQEALADVRWVFEVVPVQFLRGVLQQAKPYVTDEQVWVLLSKGIEQDTCMLPSAVLDDVLGTHVQQTTLSGPNFAKDLIEQIPTATTVAASSCEVGQELQQLLSNKYFRPYLSLDIMGVQIGGAIKNVLALAIGIAKGAGCKDNTVAYLLTRGLQEMASLTQHLGGKQETIYGLSGLGDLVLTSMGEHGRNMRVGMMVGQGKSLDDVLAETGIIAEGVNTVQSLHQIIAKAKLDLPICSGVYDILYGDQTIDGVIEGLMARPLTQECV